MPVDSSSTNSPASPLSGVCKRRVNMSLWLVAGVAGLLCLVSCAHADDSEITKFMKHLEVIPDVIDDGPKDFLKILYASGVMADKGVELKPMQVESPPRVTWTSETPDTYYTLIMVDPDAPSRAEPSSREWQHWLVANIPGNKLNRGEVVSQYVGAGPPKGTGLHRYVFLLYKQPKKLEIAEPRLNNTSALGREKFSTRKFVALYDLGVPVAGNFFQAQYEAYVEKLYKQLQV